MKPQDGPLLAAHLFFVVGVDHQRKEAAVHAHRRLDDVGQVPLLGLFVEVAEILAAELGVLLEIEVSAIGNPLQLLPAKGELVLHVEGRLGVVGQLIGPMGPQAQLLGPDPKGDVPVQPFLFPVVQPLLVRAGLDEELHLLLFELAEPEDVVAGRDLVAERLTLLRDAEGDPLAGGVEDVLELHEHALGGLRPQVDLGGRVLNRTKECFEHEVELPRLAEFPGAAVGAHPLEVVLAEALMAVLALHQGIGEAGDVPRSLPDLGRHDDAGLEPDDVVAQLHHLPPPELADVVLQGHPQGPEVVDRVDAAVYLAGGEDEATALGQRDQRLDQPFGLGDAALCGDAQVPTYGAPAVAQAGRLTRRAKSIDFNCRSR